MPEYYEKKAAMEAPYFKGNKIVLDLNELEVRQSLKIYVKLLINDKITEEEYPEIHAERVKFAEKLQEMIEKVDKYVQDDYEEEVRRNKNYLGRGLDPKRDER